MNKTEWLQSLKAGDEVYVSNRDAGYLKKITRITPSQIILSFNITGTPFDKRFRKDSGIQIGGTIWDSECIHEPTEEIREQVALSRMGREAKKLISELVIPRTMFELSQFNNTLRSLIKSVEKHPGEKQ